MCTPVRDRINLVPRKSLLMVSFFCLKIMDNYSKHFVRFGCWFDSCTYAILWTCYIGKTLFSIKYKSIYVFDDVSIIRRTNSCCFCENGSNTWREDLKLKISYLRYPHNILMSESTLELPISISYLFNFRWCLS